MKFAQIRSLTVLDVEQGDEAAQMFQPAVYRPATGQYGTLAGVTEDGRALVEFGAVPAVSIRFAELEGAS